jgi:oligopeptide transport system substrate-binding protein
MLLSRLRPLFPFGYSEAKDSPGFHFVPLQVNQYIGMNYLAKPLDNIKIRQALALAINKDLIVHSIMGDMMFPSNHIVPKGSPGYNLHLTGPDDASTKGDQNKARQLLTEGMKQAGYSSVNILPQISLTYSIDDSISSNVMSAIVSQWKEVLGITVKLNGIHNNDLYQQEAATVGNRGPLQIWYDLWGASYPDPQNWLSTFFAKRASQNAFNYGQNNSSAASAQQAVQTQLVLADREQDTAKRMKLYQDAEQKIVDDGTWITICQAALLYVVNPKVQNFKISPMAIITPEDVSQIYIAQ